MNLGLINGNGGLNEVAIISDFSPANNTGNVDVFTSPQVVFNIAAEKPFELEGNNGVSQYKVNVQNFKNFKVLNNGQPIAGTWKLSDNKSSATFEPSEILPPDTKLKAIVGVSFDEYKNGAWNPVYNDGKPAIEQKEYEFTTGTAPDSIPPRNILYSYPVAGQQYFYPNQFDTAYLQLKLGQAYLFRENPERFRAQFENTKNETQEAVFQYDSLQKRITLVMPVLAKKQAYAYTLVRLPEPGTADHTRTETTATQLDEDASVEVNETKAEGVLLQNKPHVFATSHFTTSRYGTFKEKIQTKAMKYPLYEIISSTVGSLQADVEDGQEGFDKIELTGADHTNAKPLIQPMATLTDAYFQQDIDALLYQGYPLHPAVTISRDSTQLGLRPAKGLDILSWYVDMLETSPNAGSLQTKQPYRYHLSYWYDRDFKELQNKAVNLYVNNPNAFPMNTLGKYLVKSFPLMRGKEKYTVSFRYILPGFTEVKDGNKDAALFDYINPIK